MIDVLGGDVMIYVCASIFVLVSVGVLFVRMRRGAITGGSAWCGGMFSITGFGSFWDFWLRSAEV